MKKTALSMGILFAKSYNNQRGPSHFSITEQFFDNLFTPAIYQLGSVLGDLSFNFQDNESKKKSFILKM